MAENTISVLASGDNPITHTINGQPAVTSKEIALRFQKKHKEILRDIARIQSMVPKDFYERNFAPIEESILLPHSGGIRKDPAFLLSRDAFSLLAMGFTGKAAIAWKIKYIQAFNQLESMALEIVKAKARHEGITLNQRLDQKHRANIKKALRYQAMGLSCGEIGKLMGYSHQRVSSLLIDAKLIGMGV